VFLDEIGDMPLAVQAKMLRFLQDQRFERVGGRDPIRTQVRVLAATNQDLLTAIAEKRFRQDLYYRLNVARFQLHALRERREDLPDLLTYFMEKYNKKMGTKARLDEGVLEALNTYDFPGNIRELEHMIEQAVALVQNGVVTRDDVLPEARPSDTGTSRNGRTLADVVDTAERQAIEGALRDCDGSREKAAEVLGISATTLWRKMTRLGIVYDARS
jgi:two-component system response regulator HydG